MIHDSISVPRGYPWVFRQPSVLARLCSLFLYQLARMLLKPTQVWLQMTREPCPPLNSVSPSLIQIEYRLPNKVTKQYLRSHSFIVLVVLRHVNVGHTVIFLKPKRSCTYKYYRSIDGTILINNRILIVLYLEVSFVVSMDRHTLKQYE